MKTTKLKGIKAWIYEFRKGYKGTSVSFEKLDSYTIRFYELKETPVLILPHSKAKRIKNKYVS